MTTNTGNRNSGDFNSGNFNSGNCNSGNCNSGYGNSGRYNSGNSNSGYSNSGHYNSGKYNSGYHNSGDYNTGDCNTNNQTVRIFNNDSGWEFYGDNHNRFRNILSKHSRLLLVWINSSNMTEDEKKENPSHKTTGGFLRSKGNKMRGTLSKEDREFLLNVPNFDAKILEETTGIVLDEKKIITIDGKDITISKESFEELKKQLT